jgi:hypothetical protein
VNNRLDIHHLVAEFLFLHILRFMYQLEMTTLNNQELQNKQNSHLDIFQ